jgi:D-alanyl-D-alanine dipeptidase
VKQYFKKPIKTIKNAISATCPGRVVVIGLLVIFLPLTACRRGRENRSPATSPRHGGGARDVVMLIPMDEPTGNRLVVLQDAIPTLRVDLRYARSRNVSRKALYDAAMPAMLDAPTARKLAAAQSALLAQGYGLKVWDAYRPPEAHLQLWHRTRRSGYVADPRFGWSKHCSGRAVDVTLVDARSGRDLAMPSKFDDFSSKAASHYRGSDLRVLENVKTLRRAMIEAGFIGIDMEWWHYENAAMAYRNLPPIYADEAGVKVPK